MKETKCEVRTSISVELSEDELLLIVLEWAAAQPGASDELKKLAEAGDTKMRITQRPPILAGDHVTRYVLDIYKDGVLPPRS